MEHFTHFSPDEQIPPVLTDLGTFGCDKQKHVGIHILATM